MNTGLIYKITNTVNNKCYIGQTRKKFEERLWVHLSEVKKGKNHPFYNAIRKYGWENFITEILEDNIPLEKLNIKELIYTSYYSALFPDGYVLIAGSSPTRIFSNIERKCSEETKKKISESNKGKIISQETRHKISEKIKKIHKEGKIYTKEQIEKQKSTYRKNFEEGKHITRKGCHHTEETKIIIGLASINAAERRRKYNEENPDNKIILTRKSPSIETRRKMSDAQKGKKKLKLVGKKRTEETKRKISESQKGKIISQETRHKIRKTLTGRKMSEECKRKISLALKGKKKKKTILKENLIIKENNITE